MVGQTLGHYSVESELGVGGMGRVYMMAVAATAGPTFQAGKPHMLWSGEYTHGLSSSGGWRGTSRTSYDVSTDGERFLMIKDDDQSLFATKITVVVNWAVDLNRMMVEQSATRK